MTIKTVDLQCVADTYIDDKYQNTNYGSSVELMISGKVDANYNISRRAWPFFKFDSLPADFSWDKFVSAEFGFYVTYFYPADSRAYHFVVPAGAWNEYTLTWKNRPTMGATIKDEEKYVDHTGVYTFSFSKTQLSQSLRDGAHPEFMIWCNYYSDQFESAIGSREHVSSKRPYIRLSYNVPAKPTVLTCYNATTQEGVAVNIQTHLASNGLNLSGKSIVYDFDGTLVKVTTGSGGYAVFTLPAEFVPPTGTYAYSAEFEGDADYRGSTCGGTLTVTKPMDICSWINSKGGPSGLTISTIFELIDSYLYSTPPTGYSFVPTIAQIFGVIDYYLGFDGDAKTGCDYF